LRQLAEPELVARAEQIATSLGRALIAHDCDIILSGTEALDACLANAAVEACLEKAARPDERITTVLPDGERGGWGRLERFDEDRKRFLRTDLVRRADAVVALRGGEGAADLLDKVSLSATKLLFPIAVAGGSARDAWARLQERAYRNRVAGDLRFLNDATLTPEELATAIARQCATPKEMWSRRIFVVHGHDVALRSEVTRFLERLDLTPVVLHDLADRGRTLFAKLRDELSDVGFGIVLLTPDDLGRAQAATEPLRSRARQNVVLEFGLLLGRLAPERVLPIVRGERGGIELPSDIDGLLCKQIPPGAGLDAIAADLVKELRMAGYDRPESAGARSIGY
jgi:predicted nucleotide-binding protein